jgi:hypothetical protein
VVRGQSHVLAALYHWLKEPSWFGLRASLDTEARGKVLCLCRDPIPVVQSLIRYHTDWPSPALQINLKTCAEIVLNLDNWQSSAHLELTGGHRVQLGDDELASWD